MTPWHPSELTANLINVGRDWPITRRMECRRCRHQACVIARGVEAYNVGVYECENGHLIRQPLTRGDYDRIAAYASRSLAFEFQSTDRGP